MDIPAKVLVHLLVLQQTAKIRTSMAKTLNKLTDIEVKNSAPRDKTYKLSDGGNLYLVIEKTGRKYWRMEYRFAGKQDTHGIGPYPKVNLKAARSARDTVSQQLKSGTDPNLESKRRKLAEQSAIANTFKAVADEWKSKKAISWSASNLEKITWLLDKNLNPWLGSRPIASIAAPDLLQVLRKIEDRGAHETAHRAKQVCGQIFRYAIATGRAERDPAADLKDALAKHKTKHHAAITEPKQLAGLLRAMESYTGSLIVRSALKLSALLFVRPGELRHMEWTEVDLDSSTWSIPAEKMKMKQPHLVPLCTQALEIIRDLQQLTGRSKYVFPSERGNSRPMSENTVNVTLRTIGYDNNTQTAHGFRATARTILDEVLGFRPDHIEHQLAHEVRDPNGRAYNRTAHLPARREMMQTWADYLDGLRKGANVVSINSKRA